MKTCKKCSIQKELNEFGKNKYGTPLQPFNGRNSLVDYSQELMDAIVYAKQEIYEKEWEEQKIKDLMSILYEDGKLS